MDIRDWQASQNVTPNAKATTEFLLFLAAIIAALRDHETRIADLEP